MLKALLPLIAATVTLGAQEVTENKEVANHYLSLKLESERAITTGVAYLKGQQQPEGHWGDPKTPAVTALALTAVLRDPSFDHDGEIPEWVSKGFDFLRSCKKPDGGIYGKGLATYNTSTSMMAFLALGKEEDEPLILSARAFLINQQTDWGNKGETDDQFDGGIGYGGSYPHSDMSNTYLSLEALYHSKQLATDSKHGKQPKLDWEAALQFVSRCQNLTETNDQPFASDDPDNKGGFVYFPTDSKAGEQELPDGTVALRSYGSMSYAGLLSFIYADLEKDDPRIVAVLDWLGRNYTLAENPGLGEQGLYYYYQTIAKALSAAGVDKLKLPDGKEADWRLDLTRKLLANQREDGSWINSNSRWWENDPVLVTSYTVLSLAQLHAVM
ncbi:prenyltransferase/squalene oxidase repeat-containing protein [Roseibacillus persicicus]|uniref:prenyltransferase/squalene oxidase repeat-containing protein n=1 Tax=Roseibacillus persicicus TaxID=454148 RepID=UPI00280D1A7F|nr:prenyltransferase/squalene oxidase repeat-containing protein [Roseibacillus persicicus]MDQ8191113.1 prenyltransferase/squalene oxidase repeat-containing protein [Roseibacillus persicicus]